MTRSGAGSAGQPGTDATGPRDGDDRGAGRSVATTLLRDAGSDSTTPTEFVERLLPAFYEAFGEHFASLASVELAVDLRVGEDGRWVVCIGPNALTVRKQTATERGAYDLRLQWDQSAWSLVKEACTDARSSLVDRLAARPLPRKRRVNALRRDMLRRVDGAIHFIVDGGRSEDATLRLAFRGAGATDGRVCRVRVPRDLVAAVVRGDRGFIDLLSASDVEVSGDASVAAQVGLIVAPVFVR